MGRAFPLDKFQRLKDGSLTIPAKAGDLGGAPQATPRQGTRSGQPRSDADGPASAPGTAPPSDGPVRAPPEFFLKVRPWRRTNRQTVSWLTDVPRAHSSAAKARRVKSRFSSRRAFSQVAISPVMMARAGAPRGRGARSAPARDFWPDRTAVAADTPNRKATERTVSPLTTADAIRVRRSSESDDGMVVHLSAATQPNHNPTPLESLPTIPMLADRL